MSYFDAANGALEVLVAAAAQYFAQTSNARLSVAARYNDNCNWATHTNRARLQFDNFQMATSGSIVHDPCSTTFSTIGMKPLNKFEMPVPYSIVHGSTSTALGTIEV